MNLFSFNFPLREYFFWFAPSPPPVSFLMVSHQATNTSLRYCFGWLHAGGLIVLKQKLQLDIIFLTVNAGPSEIKKLNWMHYYSYNGDAHDANVQNNIKENFFKLLKDPFFIPPPFCLVNNRCSKDKISISAGVVGT